MIECCEEIDWSAKRLFIRKIRQCLSYFCEICLFAWSIIRLRIFDHTLVTTTVDSFFVCVSCIFLPDKSGEWGWGFEAGSGVVYRLYSDAIFIQAIVCLALLVTSLTKGLFSWATVCESDLPGSAECVSDSPGGESAWKQHLTQPRHRMTHIWLGPTRKRTDQLDKAQPLSF